MVLHLQSAHFWAFLGEKKMCGKNWRQNLKNSLKIAQFKKKLDFFGRKNLYKIWIL